MKKIASIKETVFSQQNKIKLMNIETQRELDLKDKSIIIKHTEMVIAKLEAANKRNERFIYISGIALLLVIIGLGLRKFTNRNKKHRDIMAEISQIQSHDLRAPVAKIIGLTQQFNHNDPTDPENGKLIEYISSVTLELDEIIRKIVNKASR